MAPSWQLTEIKPTQKQFVPRTEEISKRYRSLTEALVREFIQNSLDARTDEELFVRISFGISNAPLKWLEGLREHLEACSRETRLKLPIPSMQELRYLFSPGKKTRYLLIEDFKTRGLTGETGSDTDYPEGSDFYDFVYWEGASRKTGLKGGRWGVGKTVFYGCSKVRAFFALTKRHDDGRRLLIGLCSLVPHMLKGRRFAYDGYFREEDGMPIEDPRIIEEFCGDFNIERTGPGLSLVIPMRLESINPDQIKAAVISHWFYPIARGKLSVQIIAEEQTEINAQTLVSVADQLDWKETETWWESRKKEDIQKLLKFAVNCDRVGPVELSIDPDYLPSDFTPIIQQMEEAKERYNRGEILAFKVPVEIKRKDYRPIRSFFIVYLQRDKELREANEYCDEYYIRRDILVPGVAGQLRGRCVRSLLVADDEGIAHFLGDAEPPFHDDWNANTTGFSITYERARNTLGFVKKCPSKLVDALEELGPKEVGTELFKEYFYLEEVEKASRGKKTERKPEITLTPGIPLVEIRQVERGFAVSLTEEGKKRLPLKVRIRMAYATLTGNPLKHYSPVDFDVEMLHVQSQGCSILQREKNLICLKIMDPDFRLEIRGFDEKRELDVRSEVIA